MSFPCPDTTCAIYVNARCSFYESFYLPYTGIITNDSLQTSLQKIELAIKNIIEGGGGGSSIWGSITGTITNQADLITYLSSNYTPQSRTLTINGVAFDLSINRTWNVGTVTSVAALTLGTTGTDLNSSVANSTTTPVITLNVPTASALNRGVLSAADWSTFNTKQSALTGTQGDIIYFSALNTISNLPKNATATRYLSNTGSSNNPAWAQISLLDGVSGTLPIANGGTGLSTIAARSIFVANTLDTLLAITPAAGQSIRINAGNTAWEVFTPSSGGIGGTIAATQVGYGSGVNTLTSSSSFTFDISTIKVVAGKFEATDVLDTGTPDGAFLINRTLTSSVAANGHGYKDNTTFSRSTFAYNSYDARTIIGLSGDYSHYAGFQSGFNFNSVGGTILNTYGFVSINSISAGTITNSYGGYVYDLTGPGVVTNQFGYYTAPLSKGTNNWAFYSAGTTKSFYGGNALYGSTTERTVNTTIPKIQIEGTNAATASASIIRNSNDAAGGSYYIGKSRGTTVGSSTIVQSGDILGNLYFTGADGTNISPGAFIRAVISGTPGSGDLPTDLFFATSNDGSISPTEKLRITSDGIVRIVTIPTNNNALTQILGRNSVTGDIEYRDVSTFSITPAGSDTQIQFNNAGAFGADADLSFTGGNTLHTQIISSSVAVGGGGGLIVKTENHTGVPGFLQAVGGSATSGDTKGGGVIIGSGAGVGTGLNGDVHINLIAGRGGLFNGYFIIDGLPTSSAGLPSGAVYSDVGILTIVP